MSPWRSPRRQSDQLLARIRALVRENARDGGRSGVELEAQRREIDRLKSALADVVRQTGRDGQ